MLVGSTLYIPTDITSANTKELFCSDSRKKKRRKKKESKMLEIMTKNTSGWQVDVKTNTDPINIKFLIKKTLSFQLVPREEKCVQNYIKIQIK